MADSAGDVLWAGNNVEPRILEVLPAAVVRLPTHFQLIDENNRDLLKVVEHLKRHAETGPDFLGIPYIKLKVWVDLPLRDKRVKRLTEKRIMKTYRLHKDIVQKLERLSKDLDCTETEVLERAVLSF